MTSRMAPVLLYDGDCGFCTTSALWISRHWRVPARAVPWQQVERDELRALGITRQEARAAAWWIDESGRRWRGHLAIAHSLAAAHGWRSGCGRVLLNPPVRWLASAAYPLVVRWRRRLPGGTRSCRT